MMDIDKIEGLIGISHLGIVVPDINIAYNQYALLGFQERQEGIITDTEHGIYAKVIENDRYVFELISPMKSEVDSPYVDLLKMSRYSMDHVCYKVASIEKAVESLKRKRFISISKVSVSHVWDKKVVLLGNRKMGVIELLEE